MRALILQNEPLYTGSLECLLRGSLGFTEVTCSIALNDAVCSLEQENHDLIVADIASIDLVSTAGLKTLIGIVDQGKVVTLDTTAKAIHIHTAKMWGANAYIPKTFSRELIESALRFVLAGGDYFPEYPAASRLPASSDRKLSPRQMQVLSMLGRGSSNSEIARELNISIGTVKLHVHSILKTTGAQSRSEFLQQTIYAPLSYMQFPPQDNAI